MKSFDQLFATAGQLAPVRVTPGQGGRRTLTSYELEIQARALESIAPKKQDWGTKVHHALDLDPIRDEDEEDIDEGEIERQLARRVDYERTLTPAQAVRVRSVYIRLEEEDFTLYDGVPVEVLLRESKRPFKGQPTRSLVADALRRKRNGLPSQAFAFQE